MKRSEQLTNYEAKQQVVKNRQAQNKKDNRLALLGATVAIVIALAGQFTYFSVGPGASTEEELMSNAESAGEQEQTAPESTLDPSVPNPDLSEYRAWQGEMTVGGEPIAFELDGEAAPQAVANFISLTKDGYFDGVSCHRLTTAGIFVLQCGDPNGDGTGGPGYSFGPIENAPSDDLYPEGTIAMARRGGDDFSMGSQFFIVYQDSQIPADNVGGYTIFGSVTNGLDAIKAIAELGVSGGRTDGPPIEAVTLENVSVE